MSEKNEVVEVVSVDLVEQLKNPEGKVYCSLEDDGTRKSKIAIINALNNADDEVANHIGEVLEIVDVAAFPVTVIAEETGEVSEALRVVLIDKKGVSYSATSQGISNSLARIFAIIGTPDNGAWKDEPVKMKIKQVKTRNGNNKVNTIELV